MPSNKKFTAESLAKSGNVVLEIRALWDGKSAKDIRDVRRYIAECLDKIRETGDVAVASVTWPPTRPHTEDVTNLNETDIDEEETDDMVDP